MNKVNAKKNLSPSLEFQSLLLKIYRHLIFKHIERIEMASKSVKNEKLRLKGGAKTKQDKGPKTYASKNDCLNSTMNVLRNCSPFQLSRGHKKCEVSLCCSFCFLRSTIIKINNPKGRHSLIPTEVEFEISKLQTLKCEANMMSAILKQACKSNHGFERSVRIYLKCSSCLDLVSCSDDSMILNIDSDCNDRSVQNLLDIKLKNMYQTHLMKHIKVYSESCIQLAEEQTSMLIACTSMSIDLSEDLVVGNTKMKCVAAISRYGSTYFQNNGVWYLSSTLKNEVYSDKTINASVALYERKDMSVEEKNNADDYAYSGQELIKIRNKLGDRHLNSEKRKRKEFGLEHQK